MKNIFKLKGLLNSNATNADGTVNEQLPSSLPSCNNAFPKKTGNKNRCCKYIEIVRV